MSANAINAIERCGWPVFRPGVRPESARKVQSFYKIAAGIRARQSIALEFPSKEAGMSCAHSRHAGTGMFVAVHANGKTINPCWQAC
jgi:hypothetical protein